jgi:hypothetical protein
MQMPVNGLYTLPRLHFVTRVFHRTSIPFETRITSHKHKFSFFFNCNQKAVAIKFFRLCTFILYRLRNYFFSKLENPNQDLSNLFRPLARIINEIISDYNLTLRHPFNCTTENVNWFGSLLNLDGPFSDFPTFLNKLNNKLTQISQTDLPELIFDQINRVYSYLDISHCMVSFFRHHVYPLYKANLTAFNKTRITFNSFQNYKHRLSQRKGFSLIDLN